MFLFIRKKITEEKSANFSENKNKKETFYLSRNDNKEGADAWMDDNSTWCSCSVYRRDRIEFQQKENFYPPEFFMCPIIFAFTISPKKSQA